MLYFFVMFWRTAFSHKLIAFLLPLTFIWSWAACSLLCSEITARHEKQSPVAAEQKGSPCLAGIDTDDCPYTATAAVTEARQNLNASVEETTVVISLSALKFTFISASVYPADINQNSPPPASSDPPLFLRHCTFRI